MKKIFAILLAFCFVNLPALTIKEKLLNAAIGDYIVFDRNNHFYLLFIKSRDENTLVLEEIATPKQKFLSNFSIHATTWNEWVKNFAPFHSSWHIYTIDTATAELIKCYSLSKKAYVKFSPDDLVLLKLLTYELKKIPLSQRKKIGPPPQNDENDNRPLWNPPFTYNGKLLKKKPLDVFEVQIEENIKNLKIIHLYFDADNMCPFPYWIQIDEPFYTFMFKGVYCGHGIISPARLE